MSGSPSTRVAPRGGEAAHQRAMISRTWILYVDCVPFGTRTGVFSPTTTSGGRQSEKLVFRGGYNDVPLKFDTPQLHQIFSRGYAIRNPARVFGGRQVARGLRRVARLVGRQGRQLVQAIDGRLFAPGTRCP